MAGGPDRAAVVGMGGGRRGAEGNAGVEVATGG